MSALSSQAEAHAQEAQVLPAFADLNVVGVKAKVEEILKLVGRDGLFHEYTLHDISHVNKMVGMLDWLLTDDTQSAMTPADWLLVVFSIYFHDMGLLVTRAEFDARAESSFGQYSEEVLFAGPDGAEYQKKVDRLGGDAAKFLYQDFVRAHHADRVADWIRGNAHTHRGISKAMAAEVAAVLNPLPAVFREDLARVCESHHSSDLGDAIKYKVSQPYGDSDDEEA